MIFLNIHVVEDAVSIVRNQGLDLRSSLSPDSLALKFKLSVACRSYIFVGTLMACKWILRILHQVALPPGDFSLNGKAEYAVWRLLFKSLEMQLSCAPSLV